MDRAHRIGQKKEVQVFRFCTENSIEEKVREGEQRTRGRGGPLWGLFSASNLCNMVHDHLG